MAAMDSQHLELDLHLLELRFAGSDGVIRKTYK